jgi:ferredoxin
MVRLSFYKSSAASFDKVSSKILKKHVAVDESIEVEVVGFDEQPPVVRRTQSDPSGYITETFLNEQETDDADDEKKQVRITATADTETWVSHSSSDIPSDLGHSQSGTEEWSSEQSDAFDGVSDGIPSIATASNGSEEKEEDEEDINVIIDAIAECNFDIVWSGNSVVCVDKGDINTSNPREEDLIDEKDLATEIEDDEGDVNTSNPREEELVNEKDLATEVKDGVLDCIVDEEENANFNDRSEKDVKEECINEDSQIEKNNSDDIAKEECVVEIHDIEVSSDNDVDIDEIGAGKSVATSDKLIKEDSRADCAIELDTNEESNDCDETVGARKTMASSDKLTTLIRERISAINNIRGLLERESETSKYCFISV